MTDRVEEARTRLECSGCGLHSISGVSDLIAAIRAEQPAAVATPKRPCTHMVDPREKYCADCWGKPSLLREAEAVFAAIDRAVNDPDVELAQAWDEARAEVERLKRC